MLSFVPRTVCVPFLGNTLSVLDSCPFHDVYFPFGREAVTSSSFVKPGPGRYHTKSGEREGREAQKRAPNRVCIGSRFVLAGSRENLLRDGITESQSRGSRPAQGKAQMVSISTGQARGFRSQGLSDIRFCH